MDNNLYAGFWIRSLAFLIDLSIVFIFLLLFSIFYGVTILLLGKDTPPNFILTGVSIISLNVVLYFVLFHIFWGATVGKKLLYLKVLKTDFTEARTGRIIVRETFGRLLSAVLFLGYIVILFRKDKRGFHDLISDTIVTRKYSSSKYETLKIISVFICIGIFFAFSLLSMPFLPGFK